MNSIKSSATPDVNNVLCISRKHWSAYVFHSILFIIGLYLASSGGFWIFIGVVIMLAAAMKILSNFFVKWTLTEEEVIVEGGFLPWAKTYREIPFYDIFEAFYNPSFLGHIFGYGRLTIRRSEGTTTSFSSSCMNSNKEMTSGINTFIRKLKTKDSSITYVNNQVSISMSDELERLHELREKGILTADEFIQRKNRLLAE